MKRAATRHLLWGGLLLYCLANTETFVLFVTHLVQVKQKNMHIKNKRTNKQTIFVPIVTHLVPDKTSQAITFINFLDTVFSFT